MTPKQERFVAEYLIDLNATQAAIRAGYSEKTAYSIGDENLKKPEVAAAVKTEQHKRAGKTELTQEWVLTRLAKEIETAKSDSARVAALGLAMKHLGMMTEDKPHPDRKMPDLSGLSRDDVGRLLAILRPVYVPARLVGGGAAGGGLAHAG